MFVNGVGGNGGVLMPLIVFVVVACDVVVADVCVRCC